MFGMAPVLDGTLLALMAGFTIPHPAGDAPPRPIKMAGQSYVDHVLVAAGRLPAATVDFLGDTLGSFSSLAVQRDS